MRLFFGVMVQNKDKKPIERLINYLKEGMEGNFTDSKNLHITLAFIGEVDEKVSYMLAQIGDKAFSNLHSFVVQGHRVNSFKEGKVNYLEIESDERLNKLYNDLTYLLDESGLVYNHSDVYHPHVTLRRGKKYSVSEDIENIDIEISEICLFESKRVDGVLRYIPLKSWRAKEM